MKGDFNYDYLGIELLKIAAFLFAARFIAAALYMGPGSKEWSSTLFTASYGYVGSGLSIGAAIAALVGVAMLALAVWKKRR